MKKKKLKNKEKSSKEEGNEPEEVLGRKEKGKIYHLKVIKDVENKKDDRNRCETCIFWHMQDPKNKQTSCFDRGYGQHDVCSSYTPKPPKVTHHLIREVQSFDMPELFSLYDVIGDRERCIKNRIKKDIRTMIRKQGGSVVYYKVPGEKKKFGKVERVTSSSVMFKEGSKDEKVRIEYVREIISLDEYKARKKDKINKREEPGRREAGLV